jgi:hypothetical protein
VRDSAILRLIYIFEAVWKACQQLLAAREDYIDAASPNTVIRAARRLSWLREQLPSATIESSREEPVI